MLKDKFKYDLKISLKVVWTIVSVIILFIITMSVFFPDSLIKSAPVCLSKSLSGADCIMCGMTRAFSEIPKGNLSGATDLNSFSIALFFIFVFNTIIFFYAISKKIKDHFYILKNQFIH